MKIKKRYINIFIYVSFIFLIYHLYTHDYLVFPENLNILVGILSLVTLVGGTVIGSVVWKKYLESHDFPIGYIESYVSLALPIFSKYIPGKLWSIMGRAGVVAQKKGFSLKQLSVISLNAQFFTLWSNFFLGVIGLLLLGKWGVWGWGVFALWALLSALVFSRFFHDLGERLFRLILKRDIKIPQIRFRSALGILPWFLSHGVMMVVAFYLLMVSVTDGPVSFVVGFGFPLATALGIVALIAPGGLGVREGALVGFLTLAGYPVEVATTAAVASRLWFILAEVCIFLSGFLLDKTVLAESSSPLSDSTAIGKEERRMGEYNP